jgi:hypothetical protein
MAPIVPRATTGQIPAEHQSTKEDTRRSLRVENLMKLSASTIIPVVSTVIVASRNGSIHNIVVPLP